MQADHDPAGALLDSIKQLTSNYNAPGDACNSYKFLFKKLEELVDDLRVHIHFENNILFPKALQLQRKLRVETSKALQ